MSPETLRHQAQIADIDSLTPISRYKLLRSTIGPVIFLLSVIPLLMLTGITCHQYSEVLLKEQRVSTSQITSQTERTVETLLRERLATLTVVTTRYDIAALSDEQVLNQLLRDLKRTHEGFIDMGLIGPDGVQISYAGPSKVPGRSFAEDAWFRQVRLKKTHFSDVFLGQLDFPHFVVAEVFEEDDHQTYVLRATVDMEVIGRLLPPLIGRSNTDIFLVNHAGLLQTPSRFYGAILSPCPLSEHVNFEEEATFVEKFEGPDGKPLLVGYAAIDDSPLNLMVVNKPSELESWVAVRRDLVIFASACVLVMMLASAVGSKFIVGRLRGVDRKRAESFHNLEYTNKMAAIGRLSAGVAHEINNPLAIIEENAGLLKDLVTMSDERLPNEKVLQRVEPILRSIERCSAITHRLLGFAKHMDVSKDRVNLEVLVKEVLGFLDKEAGHRGLEVSMDVPADLPEIETGRGQLQQVFLNIINNAFQAVEDNGTIHVSMDSDGKNKVTVHIVDNGVGIPEEHLKHVFEPFFTTKGGSGTGLGLSITYGIVEKLGGTISVTSKVGEGTCFIIELPIRRS